MARRPPARRGAGARARGRPAASASISISPSASRRTARPPGRTARSSCRPRGSARRRTISTRTARTGASRRCRRPGSSRASFEPYRESIDAVVRHAGALRIDHAMSLYRLFWIAESFDRRRRRLCPLSLPRDAEDARRRLAGAPDHRSSARISASCRPASARRCRRPRSRATASSSSRRARTISTSRPKHYPREALACVSIHDLHTLAGWWSGHDIDVRHEIGMLEAVEVGRA